MNEICPVNDLRSALEYLKTIPGQYLETDVEVDPIHELSGVYRRVGAGGTVQRPTREGPAMMFTNIKGHPGAKIAIGLMASRKRVAHLLGTEPQNLGRFMMESVTNPVAPVTVDGPAPCQEEVYLASDPDFDVRKLVPASTNTPDDGGPYITLGLLRSKDPETGETDVTIHRLCIHDADTISVFLQPGSRHLGMIYDKYAALGKPMPLSISIGLDPAIYIGACFEPPTTPYGYDELSVAGSLRKQPVELVKCKTQDIEALAKAEIVIEGEILPGVTVKEDATTGTGYAMPEFPGYTGDAFPRCNVIKVSAVTTRKDPIMQTCIGPSEEHVSMAGIPTEASILSMVERALPGKVTNVYAHSAGGGKYMAVLQIKKTVPTDEGKQRQAALLAFSAFPELKNVILVDDDVDIFDSNDVLWAMNTRFQGNVDTGFIPGVRGHPLDPSSQPESPPLSRDRGISCKTIFDATVPFDCKKKFVRARFMDVDPSKWAPDLF